MKKKIFKIWCSGFSVILSHSYGTLYPMYKVDGCFSLCSVAPVLSLFCEWANITNCLIVAPATDRGGWEVCGVFRARGFSALHRWPGHHFQYVPRVWSHCWVLPCGREKSGISKTNRWVVGLCCIIGLKKICTAQLYRISKIWILANASWRVNAL